jgi:hypothetical protein
MNEHHAPEIAPRELLIINPDHGLAILALVDDTA